MMQNIFEMTETLAYGYSPESAQWELPYPMNTIMTGIRWFFEILWVLVLWTKVASALEGLNHHFVDFLLLEVIWRSNMTLHCTLSMYPEQIVIWFVILLSGGQLTLKKAPVSYLFMSKNHRKPYAVLLRRLPINTEWSRVAWQNPAGEGKVRRIFEGEMLIRTLPTTLLKNHLNSVVLNESNVDPDDDLKGGS